jgi:hypothetical protein
MIEIFRDIKSIFFAQDEAAANIVSELDRTKTDEDEQIILSQYDMSNE